jgi:Zn-dependent protease
MMAEPDQTLWMELNKTHYQTVQSKKMAMFNTSSTELRHLFIAWLAISFAFAIMLGWHKLKNQPSLQQVFGPFIIDLMILSMITVGISFIAHEMGHKFVAQQYGAWAEFRMSTGMLIFAIFLAWEIGILFAAPGAVQIFGSHISKSQMGKIAASGPLMNLFLAFVFLPLLSDTGFLFQIGQLGVLINIALAGFNMLPVSVLDGRKVLAWNAAVYMGLVILMILTAMFLLPLAIL